MHLFFRPQNHRTHNVSKMDGASWIWNGMRINESNVMWRLRVMLSRLGYMLHGWDHCHTPTEIVFQNQQLQFSYMSDCYWMCARSEPDLMERRRASGLWYTFTLTFMGMATTVQSASYDHTAKNCGNESKLLIKENGGKSKVSKHKLLTNRPN